MKIRAEQAKARQSFKRLDWPEDLSLVVNFLASDESRWVTGRPSPWMVAWFEQMDSQISNKKDKECKNGGTISR